MKKQVYKLGLVAFLGMSAITFAQVQDGVVGINTESPTATLDVVTKTGADKSLRVENTAGVETVTVLENGNVGVGTAIPSSKLTINAKGDGVEVLKLETERPWLFKQQGAGAESTLVMKSLTSSKYFKVTNNVDEVVASFYAGMGNNKVGIGIDIPTEKLDVAGSIKSSALAGTGKRNVVADENGKLVIGGAAGGATLESLTGGIRKVDQANPTEWAKPGTFCLIQTTTAGITMPDPSQYSSKVFAVNNQSGTQLNYGGSYQPLGATTLDGGKGHFLMSDGTAWYVIGGSY